VNADIRGVMGILPLAHPPGRHPIAVVGCTVMTPAGLSLTSLDARDFLI
jgi:hypothetical protein